MKLVIIESPYFGDTRQNELYGNYCMLDSLARGEAPFASHLLYTRMLDDNEQDQRVLGIACGLAWAERADLRVFYIDLGFTPGMEAALADYKKAKAPYEFRHLSSHFMEFFSGQNNKHK